MGNKVQITCSCRWDDELRQIHGCDPREKSFHTREKPFLGWGVFQQYLASCHASKKVKEYFKKQNVNVLKWHGHSPDLNPI